MIAKAELEYKWTKVRELMREKGLSGILFRKQSNFAWLTGGGRNCVGLATEMGVGSLLITEHAQYVLCNVIEAPRLTAEEQVEDLGYAIHSYPWYDDQELALSKQLTGSENLGCDVPFGDLSVVGSDIAPLRWSLTHWEVERYREVGFMTSLAIEDAARTIRPGDKECEIVGRLAALLWENRFDFITTFCAADERISQFRHPIATEKMIDKRAMLCVNARKWGLIVSLTRFVQFGNIDEDIRRRYDANVYIDCVMMANSIPGQPVAKAFNKGLEAYREQGFEKEYELHHQGGSIGYEGRDYKVDFNTDIEVRENQGFAWNPSITGCKSEDTMLATANGPELLSRPITFPVLEVEAEGHVFRRPDILIM